MKRTSFCDIFATMFVAATVITLASCSQDDEFYEDGLFTRAEDPDAALRSIACLGKGRVKLRFTYNYDIYMACTDTVITINVRTKQE
mgnify:FL=1